MKISNIRRQTAAKTVAYAAYIVGALLIAGATTGLTPDARAEVADEMLEGLEYRLVGPFRGGRSTASSGVEGDALTYYFGGTGGGVWKTTNAGVSWNNISDEYFGVGSVGAIAVAPSDANVIFVGTGSADIRGVSAGSGDGVYRSTDAGATWTNVGLTASRQIADVVIHPGNPDIVYVAAQGSAWAETDQRGVYRSTDGGDNWSRVLYVDDTSGASDLKMDPNNPRILYATTWDHARTPWEIRSGGPGSAIWKSLDGGDSWEKLTDGLPDLMGKIGIAPSGARPGLVWAIVEAEGDEGGLYKSEDGGKTWTHINGERKIHARSWYYMHIDADPVDEHTVYVSNSSFFRSIDDGKTFARIQTPHGDHHDLWINPDNPKNMMQSNDGGGTVTFDGGATWSSIYNQPTVQIYRLTVDNAFPYRLYGGQQDNSSVGIRSRGLSGSIGHEDFSSYGGCESAFVAMDPNATKPRYYYAGCYLGQISEYDAVTGEQRDVRVYPELGFGVPPKERKYRFNWNAPVVVSAHDPSVIYHGGNILFRSTNRGISWDAISPDLTRNTPETQGPGGGPITNEVSENYNTLSYVAESPHDAGTIWTGSDDGLVQVTRNGGESWRNVTPKGVKDGLFNAIEVSPHDAGTAYVAYTRYRYNDHTPHVYKTTDYGRKWKDVAGNIPDGAFVRVVREDPARKGLLFAGTETGVWMSFDDGKAWQQLKLKLPAVPVTDIKIRHGDLILSTQGRGFWIMDDISPLRQMTDNVTDAPLHLFAPRPAFDFMTFGRTIPGNSKNPANGAWFYYTLAEEADLEAEPKADKLTLEIIAGDGEVIRTIKAKKKDGVKGGSNALPAKKGLNKFVWNLSGEPIEKIPGLFAMGGFGPGPISGYDVAPGTYTARLTLASGETKTIVEQPLEVTLDPRVTATPEGLAQRQDMLADIRAKLDELHKSIGGLRSVRDQIKAIQKHAKKAGKADGIKDAAKALIERIDAYEDAMTSPKREFFQDVLNWPDKLDANMQMLYGTIAGQIPPITDGMKLRHQEISEKWQAAMIVRDTILEGELKAFNDLYGELGLPAALMPDVKDGGDEDEADNNKTDSE